MRQSGSLYPEWATRERLPDAGWLLDNMHVFWPSAHAQYKERGRGTFVVDTTVRPKPGKGHPFSYCTQAEIKQMAFSDAERMAEQYDPEKEFVVVLLKSQQRISVYRVNAPQPSEV